MDKAMRSPALVMPPFSGKIASALQGHSVQRFDLGSCGAAKYGKGGMETWYGLYSSDIAYLDADCTFVADI